ncbi:protein tyrosine phosphatase family protein [Shewanella glacialipiscicola]|uniref:protein tyrosine phosphatase family protein n=1 Tax=Shewanella glacialipiscicola TaxID=614069 RepID=UPI003D79F409
MKQAALIALLLCSPLVYADIDNIEKINDISALQQNDSQLLSSGLPSESQFTQLKQTGIDVVINLMPDNNKGAHQDEAKWVTQAGMEYVYIPVDWQNPQLTDVETFFKAMDAHAGQDILVHCFANYRASAFVYLYQLKQGKKPDMVQTMAPWGDELARYPQWQVLLNEVRTKYKF